MEHLDPAIVAALENDLTIDITTTGRNSGEPRRIEIWYLLVDGRIWIAGTPGPRDWLANLMAEPRFIFHLKESVSADLDATASLVTDEPDRRLVFESEAARWYRQQCDVDELVATAPLVEATFDRAQPV